MDQLIFPSKLYKIRLVNTERDIFRNPISSKDWDKVVTLLYEDVKQEVFHFVHPKNKGIVYQRNYADCPVSGNAILTIGRLRDTTDYAIVSIITKSYMYHEPYLALEEISPAFPNPKILLEIVKRGFNSALKKYGLEVSLELWEGEETCYWRDDRWASYILELKKHPEIAKKNIGFQQAIAYESIVKDVEVKKKEANKKGKKQIKSDRIEDYIRLPHKEKIVRFLKEKTKGLNIQKDIARPFRFLYDRGITHHIPYKAVIKAIPEIHLKIRESRYNDWTNIQRTSYDDDPKYKDLEKEIESVLQSDDSMN